MLNFAPDIDPITQSTLVECTNVVPTTKGYTASYVGVNSLYPALASEVRNITISRKLDNTRRLFAGLQTKIYEGVSGAWTDRSGSAYDIGPDTRWAFDQFGDYTLAIAKTVNLQASSSGSFATVSGAPKASCIATSQGFAMVADTNEGTYGDQSDRWWCCAQYDHTSWTPSVATQATTGRLIDTPGPITALEGFGNGFVAFKENSMYIGTYTGAPAVFSWQMVPGEIGCRSKDAVVRVGSNLFFLGNDNFYAFDGSRPIPIGNQLREWFFKTQVNPTYLYSIIATYDRPNQFVWFFYPSVSSTYLNKALVFHVPTQRWGSVTITVEAAANYYVDSITYDGLGTIYSTFEDLPTNIAYDSPYWLAQSQVLSVANSAHTIQTMVGSAVSSSVTTCTVGDPQQFSTVNRVRPRFSVAPTSATLTHQYDDDYGDTWTDGPSSTLTNGSFDLLKSARWHREKMDMVGPWEMIDYKVMITPDGTA